MNFAYVLLKCAKCARGNANTLTVDANGLKIDVLAAAAGNIGVTAGVSKKRTFTG